MKEHYLKEELYTLIKEDNRIFDFIQQGSLDGLWYWDLEKPENEWMNERFWEVLGYDPKQMKHLASEWQDIIFQEDLDIAIDNFNKHLEDEKHPYDQIVRYRHKNGSTIWIRCRGIAIRDKNNTPIRMLGAHNDITKVMNSLEEINTFKKLEKYSKLLDDYVITSTTDLRGVITDASSAFCKISGYSKKELIGKSHNIVRHPDMKKSFYIKLWEDLKNDNIWQGEIKNFTKDKKIYWVDTVITANYNKNGEKIGYTSLRIDITDKKSLEEKNLELSSLQKTLNNAVKMANLGVWEWDVLKNESKWSDISYKTFGVKIGTPINLELVESRIYKEDLNIHRKELIRCLEEKTSFHLEYRIIKKGEIRKILAFGNPTIKNDKVIKIRGVIQDITEIKKVQEELEIAQSVAKIGHYHYNIKENIFTCSKQVDKIFEIEEDEEKTFESWLSIIHPNDQNRIKTYFNTIIQKQEKFDNEYRIIGKKTNEIKWIHGLGEFSYDKDGNISTMYGTIQDITNRKKDENKLKQALYIFENTYDGITITDENVNIINVNKSFERVTGYSLEEVKGLNPKVLKSGLHDESFYKEMWDSLNTNGFWTGEITNKNKQGKLYEELLTITAVYDKNKNISNYIGIFTDITEQKMQEKLLLQQARTSAIGEMIENIAHQWRQPLSVISTISTGLQLEMDFHKNSELDKNELYKSLSSINQNSQYLSKTIDDFRTFFKGDLEKIKTFSLQECLEKVKNLTKDIFAHKFITIIENIKKEPIYVRGNENLLVQALINIYNNAKDILDEKIEKKDQRFFFITLKKENNKGILLLRDNAGGVSEENIERIFDPYFTTKHQSQGTGLGLFMTHQIITEQMNANIEIKNVEFEYETKKYKGAEFKLVIDKHQ